MYFSGHFQDISGQFSGIQIWPENCHEMSWKVFFFFNQWIEFKFENVKYISIYLKNIKKYI
jgi:hypothetical protein